MKYIDTIGDHSTGETILHSFFSVISSNWIRSVKYNVVSIFGSLI